MELVLIIGTGALVAGFVSGLVALGFWLHAIEPILAARELPVIAWGGRAADGAVGLLGGVMGGVAGLSGPLPTLWCGLRGWSKDAQRGVYQPYNLGVLGFTLGVYAVQGVVTARVLELTMICLPMTLLGVWLGLRSYGRLDDRQFRALVLWLLLASGTVLTASNLF
jgi:uncharacterized membrane protein YfcA